MISVRSVLIALALAFTGYLAARGLWWTEQVPGSLLIVAALILYLATAWVCLLWGPAAFARAAARAGLRDGDDFPLTAGSRGPDVLPVPAAVMALVAAAVVPSAVSLAVAADARHESFATWYLGGIGVLMTIVMIRRRPWVAWVGMAMLAAASMFWMGPLDALALGLVGSLVWVLVAQLMMRSMDRAARDTARLAQLQRAASAWQASHVVRQRERRVQVQRALAIAGPVLARVIATGGDLTDEERLEARLAEGRLRDELRGPRLLDDGVRAELDRARRRGATVTVLDEGGLEGLGDDALTVIRAQLADTLRTSGSGRLYIRTSPDERIAVTVVGRSDSGAGLTDEDAVDLWREIPHPGRAGDADRGEDAAHAWSE